MFQISHFLDGRFKYVAHIFLVRTEKHLATQDATWHILDFTHANHNINIPLGPVVGKSDRLMKSIALFALKCFPLCLLWLCSLVHCRDVCDVTLNALSLLLLPFFFHPQPPSHSDWPGQWEIRPTLRARWGQQTLAGLTGWDFCVPQWGVLINLS